MAAKSPVRDICGISAVPTIKAAASSLARTAALVRTVMVYKAIGYRKMAAARPCYA